MYTIPLRGLEGWLNSENPMVEIDVPAQHSRLQIGFRQQGTFVGDWIAEPMVIDTSQAVILTEEGEIKQADAALFQMGRQAADTAFVDDSKVRSGVGGAGKLAGVIIGRLVKDSGITNAAMGIISKIPYAAIITALANVIWPEPSVSSLINDAEIRMRNLIITKIRELNLATQQGGLGAIRNNIEEYRNATGSGRMRWMDATLASFNLVKGMILNTDGAYTPGTAYLALDLAGLHLGMLRERIIFEKEIFGDEEIDTQANIRTLVNNVREYQDFLTYAIKKEVEERMSQISVSHSQGVDLVGPRAWLEEAIVTRTMVRDNVRRQIHRFSTVGGFNFIVNNEPDPERIKGALFLVDLYKQKMENEIKLKMEEDINIPSQMLDWFIPGKENTQPVSLEEVFVAGPMTGFTNLDFNIHNQTSINYSSRDPGEIGFVQVQVMPNGVFPNYGYITAGGEMRFSLVRRLTIESLVPFEKELSKDLYITRVETWWDDTPIVIRFTFSDGTDSGRIGTRHGGTYQSVGARYMGLSQDFRETRNEARKYGFRVMPSFYDLSHSD